MKWYLKIYKWFKNLAWAKYYNSFKLWLRETAFGRSVDRFVRIFVLTAVLIFLSNWVMGDPVFPLVQTSIGLALIATIDKVKNEILAKVRNDLNEAESGITRT